MIKELEGKMTKELLDKYFWHRKTTKVEKQKCRELNKMFKEFTKKVYGQEEDIFSYDEWFGYLEDYGYYLLVDGDPGKCLPYLNNYGMDKEKAFVLIIYNFLIGMHQHYEFQNRRILCKDFQDRFGIFGFKNSDKNFNELDFFDNYFNCLYYAEYDLDKWNKYYDGNTPDEIIKYYENYLNDIWWTKEKGITWKYDVENKKFNCQKNQKIKKLIK